MMGQVVSVGGLSGDAIRTVNGVIALVAFWFMFVTAMHGPIERRKSNKSVAVIWGICGVVLILGGLHVIHTTWVPWMVHGLMISTSIVMIVAARVGRKTWNKIEQAFFKEQEDES